METSGKRNIPSPCNAGMSNHRFMLRHLNSFFAPEGQVRSAGLVQFQPTASQLHAGAKSSTAPVSRDGKD